MLYPMENFQISWIDSEPTAQPKRVSEYISTGRLYQLWVKFLLIVVWLSDISQSQVYLDRNNMHELTGILDLCCILNKYIAEKDLL